jgi:hypothetical protein
MCVCAQTNINDKSELLTANVDPNSEMQEMEQSPKLQWFIQLLNSYFSSKKSTKLN